MVRTQCARAGIRGTRWGSTWPAAHEMKVRRSVRCRIVGWTFTPLSELLSYFYCTSIVHFTTLLYCNTAAAAAVTPGPTHTQYRTYEYEQYRDRDRHTEFEIGSGGPHAHLSRVIDGQWRPAPRTRAHKCSRIRPIVNALKRTSMPSPVCHEVTPMCAWRLRVSRQWGSLG